MGLIPDTTKSTENDTSKRPLLSDTMTVIDQVPTNATTLTYNATLPTTSHHDIPPPPFEEAVQNLPDVANNNRAISAEPPNYFSISITPNTPVVYPNDWTVTGGPSTVPVERDSDLNVTTYDPITESNPDRLWQYLTTYSDAPRMEIVVEGYRWEDRWDTEWYTDSNGNRLMRQVHRRERITDFYLTIDASSYVNTQWTRVVAVATKEGRLRTIREILEEFTQSKDALKEIGMTKQVAWDFNELNSALLAIARSVYPNEIEISYKPKNAHVKACASNTTARLARNNWIRCLLVVSCLWICALPVWLSRRKVEALVVSSYEAEQTSESKQAETRIGSTKSDFCRVAFFLQMEFMPTAPVAVFYQRNYYLIQSAIVSRSRRTIMAI